MADNGCNNITTDDGKPISNKAYRRQTSLSEVLIGLFMFFFGVLSLTFLACYVYLCILNGGSNSMMWKTYNVKASTYNDTII